MIRGELKRYEQYKDSGVEWLGEVPEGWQVKRIKDLSDLQSGKSLTSEDIEETGEYPVFGGGGQRGFYKNYTNDGNYSLIGRQGALCGNINFTEGKFWATEHSIVVYHNKNIEYKWYGELLRIMNLNQYSLSAAQPGLAVDRIKRLLLPVPSLIEQQVITAYLGEKTARIDRKIELLQAKADRYRELKQALINETVTRGLDPTVPMKDSGVEWIGEVPVTWRIWHLKNCVKTKITDGPHTTPVFQDEGVPFLSVEAVQNGSLNFDAMRGFISKEDDELFSLKCKPRRDDIFLVKSGSTTGKIGYVSTDVNFNIWSPLALIRCNKSFYARYLYYFLISSYFKKQIEVSWSFGTQPNIGMGVIECLQVFVPYFEEQQAIATYLDTKTAQIEQIITTITTQIQTLQELRKTLINEVVTGKIKVV